MQVTSQSTTPEQIPQGATVFPPTSSSTPRMKAQSEKVQTDSEALLDLWVDSMNIAWKKAMYPGTVRNLFQWATLKNKDVFKLQLEDINTFIVDRFDSLNKSLAHQALIGYYQFALDQNMISVMPIPSNYPKINRIVKAQRRVANTVNNRERERSNPSQTEQVMQALEELKTLIVDQTEMIGHLIKRANTTSTETAEKSSLMTSSTARHDTLVKYQLTLTPTEALQFERHYKNFISMTKSSNFTAKDVEVWVHSLLTQNTFQSTREAFRLLVGYFKFSWGDRSVIGKLTDNDFYEYVEAA